MFKQLMLKLLLSISSFLHSRGITIENMHGLGFDGACAMSGHKSGMQK